MISGFTIVRNGVRFDYPFEESILSLVPLVDELVVLVGKGDDETLECVQALASSEPKIKVFESIWDEQLKKDGLILSQQTNLAMEKCKGKWGIYLQSDELIHEKDYEIILTSIKMADQNPEIDGLLFDYIHFYADFFVVNRNPSAYRREVRAVRLDRNILSWKDAQGFRKKDGQDFRKLNVVHTGASIYHYGWVRPPEVMQQKTLAFDKLYHGERGGTGDNYIYKRIYGLERFKGTHPGVIATRVAAKRWNIDLLSAPLVFTWKDIRKVISRFLEATTGWLPFEYKNYKRID